MAIAGLKNLCTPASVYLVLSVLALVIMVFQNIGSENIYCLGTYECSVSSVSLIFIIKILYILFWTWVLNLICRAGLPMLSWFLVLFPFVLFFILIAAFLFTNQAIPYGRWM
jgi:hypothetical protein